MAEVLGLIASVVTIAGAVTGAIERAKTLQRASEELQALQASVIERVTIVKSNLPDLRCCLQASRSLGGSGLLDGYCHVTRGIS